MRLPDSCQGCPLYRENTRFTADYLPANRKITVYFDGPDGKFMGETADETQEATYFRAQFLPAMPGLNVEDIGFAHLFRCKGATRTKGDTFKDARSHCRQYDDLTNDSKIITPGFHAWQYFSNRAGSREDWGGFYVEVEHGVPVQDGNDAVTDGGGDVDNTDDLSDDGGE